MGYKNDALESLNINWDIHMIQSYNTKSSTSYGSLFFALLTPNQCNQLNVQDGQTWNQSSNKAKSGIIKN